MPKNALHYNTEKIKIYRDAYRPSSSIAYFLKSLLSVIVVGQSPMGSVSYPRLKKLTR